MFEDDKTLLVNDIVTLQTIKEVCENILSEYPSVSCYLFGSYAKGDPKRTSDIDLLLLFDKKIHTHQIIYQIKDALHNSFLVIQKYCNPIHGYKNSIKSDSHILLRQYVHYGILLSGQSVLPIMKKETLQELKRLEYTNYWTPMYRNKIRTLELM